MTSHPAIEYLQRTVLRDKEKMQQLRDFSRGYIDGVKKSGYRAWVKLDRTIMCIRFFVGREAFRAQAATIFIPNLLEGSVDPIMLIEDAVIAAEVLWKKDTQEEFSGAIPSPVGQLSLFNGGEKQE